MKQWRKSSLENCSAGYGIERLSKCGHWTTIDNKHPSQGWNLRPSASRFRKSSYGWESVRFKSFVLRCMILLLVLTIQCFGSGFLCAYRYLNPAFCLIADLNFISCLTVMVPVSFQNAEFFFLYLILNIGTGITYRYQLPVLNRSLLRIRNVLTWIWIPKLFIPDPVSKSYHPGSYST
jgi:hypothetical protein